VRASGEDQNSHNIGFRLSSAKKRSIQAGVTPMFG
jgi:hypothetical protein